MKGKWFAPFSPNLNNKLAVISAAGYYDKRSAAGITFPGLKCKFDAIMGEGEIVRLISSLGLLILFSPSNYFFQITPLTSVCY